MYTSLAISPLHWTIATMLTSFGAGFGPGLRSVALALYERGPYKGVESGRLFGAFGVVDSAAYAFNYFQKKTCESTKATYL